MCAQSGSRDTFDRLASEYDELKLRVVYPGMMHGFWQLGGVLPQALTAIEDVASVLRSHLTIPGRHENPAPSLNTSLPGRSGIGRTGT